MKKWIMNLQLFTTYTVTVYKDTGITTATASKDSGVAKDEEITLTITPASNKELDKIIVLAGGVTVNPTTKKFTCGEANVVLAVTSKDDNLYMVTENCDVSINGTKTKFTKNTVLKVSKTGAIIGVECEPTAITVNDGVTNLINSGVLIKV